MATPADGRPPVSVILPFHGDAADASEAAAALASLALRDGDEVVVADNTEAGVFPKREGFRVLQAAVKRSAYAARNIGAEAARNDWLLFIDADCRPRPDLLDRYFDPPPGPTVGALAGQVLGAEGQPGLVPAYIRSRGHLDQRLGLEHPYRPMAVTANLLVRRDVWRELGGYQEQTLSGADSDFCWRLLDAGHALELREDALVHHVHRSSLRALMKQTLRDGAGSRWASRRWPGLAPHPPLVREAVRGLAGAVAWTVLLQPRRGLFKLLDVLFVVANTIGSWQGNATPTAPEPSGGTVVFAREAAEGEFVEAERRPDRPGWPAMRSVPMRFAEDDGPAVRAGALARLALRRPAAVLAALRADRTAAARWAPAALRLRRADGVAAQPGMEDAAALAARMAGRRGP